MAVLADQFLKTHLLRELAVQRVAFDLQYFSQASHMSLFIRELRIHERLHQLYGEFFTNDSRPQAEDVHVIVFDSLMSRIGVVTDASSNTRDLVRSNADPHATSAEQNSAFRLLVENDLSDLHCVVGVVDRATRVGAAVNHLVASRLNHGHDSLL